MAWRHPEIAHCEHCDGVGDPACHHCKGTGTASGRGKEVIIMVDQMCPAGHKPGVPDQDPNCEHCYGSGFVHIWREHPEDEWQALKAERKLNGELEAKRQADIDKRLDIVRAKAKGDPAFAALIELLGVDSGNSGH